MMGERMSNIWSRISEAFGGWRAIAIALVVGATAGIGLSDLWAAPDLARQALSSSRENARQIESIDRSVQRLERTVRIYICTRPELDGSTRLRLGCSQIER